MNNNYDKIDELFCEHFKKNTDVPDIITESIKTALYTQKKYNSVKFIKKFIITIISLLTATGGMVFAGYTIYEHIWKEPQKYTTEDEYLSSLPTEEIAEQEKNLLITENEAKQIALNFLNKLGYENQTINIIELKRNYNQKNTSYYMVKTDPSHEKGLIIIIDSENGSVEYFNDLDFKYKDLEQDTITEQQAKQIAYSTYEKLQLTNKNYDLYSITKEEYAFQNKIKTLWGATFYKKENNVYNKYAKFSVTFAVVNNKIMYDTININTNMEAITNPIILSREDAIEIAKNKELEFTNTEITNINSELSIEQMNTLVYELENEIYDTTIENGGIYLKIEPQIRNVWKVSIEHKNKKDFNTYSNPNQYMKENLNKEFYIDATTGEIIGGKFIENIQH